MATRFQALEELADDALELPLKGRDGAVRVYRIPSPSALDGLKIQRITTLAAKLVNGGEAIDTTVLDDAEELDLIKLCLGPADEELLQDGVDWAWRRHAGLTAMFWITSGQETAEKYWAAAGDPSQLAPNREARRKQSGSAAASKTRSRGSTSGTSAPRASAKRRPADRT
jgi:hypothetical protein